jgi:hypothetical protein
LPLVSASTWRFSSARFWLIITKVDRNMASSDTIMVSSPKGLDPEADPGGKPDDVDIDEPHRAGESRDLVCDPVLHALPALLGVLQQRRVGCPGQRPGAAGRGPRPWIGLAVTGASFRTA